VDTNVPLAVDKEAGLVPGRTRARRVALVVCTLAWSFAWTSPGLFGTWVYDDNLMLDNPVYDGWDDIPAVVARTALDYLIPEDSSDRVPRGSETYRPVTMFVLVSTHVIAQSALLHHLVGWALHVVLAGLLLVVLRHTLRREGEPAVVVPWCLAAVFLLHPIGVEAYVWINGRSDVMAGLFVALAALVSLEATSVLPRAPLLRRSGALYLAAFLTSALAMGSKETALGALVGVWAAALIYAWQHPSPMRDSRVLIGATVAAGIGVVAYLLTWYLVQRGGFADPGEGGPILLEPDTRAFAPKLLAIGAGTLLSLEASPMQSYAWLEFRPLAPVEWLGAALGAAFLASLVMRRDGRGLALVTGAILTLLPTVVLIRSLWLGRDRYLYVPLLLLLLAAAPGVSRAVRARSERLRWLPALVWGVVVLGASASTAVASGYYQNQLTWMTSGLRPDTGDPTRYAFAAGEMVENDSPAAAAAFLAEMPPPPWPLPVCMQVLHLTRRMGNEALHDQVLLEAERAYPDSPQPRLHRLHRRLRGGDVDRALGMVPALGDTEYCPEVADILRHAGQAEALTAQHRREIQASRDRLPCVTPSDSPRAATALP
jgi:hypothetical protein